MTDIMPKIARGKIVSGEYKAIISAERELVSRFEHIAQLTDREVDARFNYYMGRGDTE